MITRTLLIFTLALASTAHAEDNAKLDQVLELLQSMKAEQDALRAEVESYHQKPAVESEAKPEKADKPRKAIKRKNGFITSVHPAPRGKVQAALGRMVVDGFPMSHAIGKEEFEVKNKGISYSSTGELKVEEDGTHSLQVGIKTNVIGMCKFRFELAGQTILDVPKIYHTSGTSSSEVDLEEGFYKFKMVQYCDQPSVTWEMKILSPTAMNPVPLTSEYFYHRVK